MLCISICIYELYYFYKTIRKTDKVMLLIKFQRYFIKIKLNIKLSLNFFFYKVFQRAYVNHEYYESIYHV